MLRLLVLLLMLGNVGYFAWSQGLLKDYGYAPEVQSEPQRLTSQIHPEAIQLLTTEEARKLEGNGGTTSAALPVGDAGSGECLQAGLFDDQQVAALRQRLETTLPPGSWQLEASSTPARWVVYMGKYNNPDTLAKKRSELRTLGLDFRSVNSGALAPGLVVASLRSEADAERELERLSGKGLRTAKVVQERAEVSGQTLMLASVNDSLRAQLPAITPLLAGNTLQPCR
jgi:hypothetical protein